MDSTWTTAAAETLERACEHHGGWIGWRSLRKISFAFGGLSGALPLLKGAGNTFPLPARVEISPHEHRTRMLGYPDADHVGIFDGGNVWLERAADGHVVSRSSNHRETFQGFSKNRRWSPLDALYFFGYAVWHYHSLPFTLTEGRLVRARVAGTRTEPLHALEVELPEYVPTHCRRQTFYFDDRGQLTRHDYTADIVGSWAQGAHHWMDYVDVDGFPFATRRCVVPRMGGTTFPGTVLLATLTDARVERRDAN